MEATVSFLSGSLLDQAEFLETGEDFVGLGEGDGEVFFDLIGGDGGMLEEVVQEGEGTVHIADSIGDFLAGRFTESDDSSSCGDGITRDGGDAAEEEFDPAFPIAMAADGGEAVIVFHAVEIEVVGEVEKRELKDITLAEKEGDEESANPTIAIKEGVNRFELCMRVSTMNESGQITRCVEKIFQVTEGLNHFMNRWRDVGGIF